MPDRLPQRAGAADELRDRLASTAAHMGGRLPLGDGDSDGRIVPQVNLNWPVGRRLARELGQLISNCGIFRQGDRVVTVDEVTGKVKTMTSRRFGSWVEQWVETFKLDRFGEERPQTMGDTLAKQVLEADQFLWTLQELKGVHPVRMPVLRDKGKSVELLKPGYDTETGIFTCDGLRFDTEMSEEEAFDVMFDLLKGYPFAEIGKDAASFRENRSAAVMMALMLGTFCRGFFPPGVIRPMGLFIGNQPGTGKGTLAMMCLAPVFGLPSLQRKPKNDEEFEKRLDTVALSMLPYMILDDIGGGLFSNALNAFITEPKHNGRKFSTQEPYEIENVTQIFATGNQIKTTRDLERRSLIVELHLAGEVEGRQFERLIDPIYLARSDVRKRMLSAMWAMVRGWNDRGCPRVGNVKPSFEKWTSVMGAIVRSAGFGDPLVKPELGTGGDESGQAWKEFLGMLAGECIMPGEESRDFTVAEMLEKAREWQEEASTGFSLDDLVGSAKDQNKAFGRRIQEWKGREIVDTRGRLVEFGNRRQAKRRIYPCTVLSGEASQ